MFQYQFLSDTDISLDATYLPSLEEWMKIKNNKTWEFYSNRAFLEVSFSRYTSLPDVTRPDAYLVYYKFKSDNSYYRDYVPYERRKQWSSSLASALAPATAGRARREAAMRAKGISIDETYVDPPLPLEVTNAN